ncbi:oligoendopeptidase F [Kushneria phosphatilytica]|uniref:Oligopeptidase F n=1 Tax=Kushneria phosphatilytica TaxID=657387 RepID=A0A1S1NVF5_9GAMM|nr:oligoendopeptidase F [Kushneria phosphatilytica]OHV10887.1 oligoendopeptidase F [Kushneria phosphatilytica]QEL12029.1 oligoendopeptidase F [Kushneria phosphatilytica]
MPCRIARFSGHPAFGLLLAGALALSGNSTWADDGEARDGRSSPRAPDEWQLSDLYASDKTWQQAFDRISQRIERLDHFQNTLTAAPEALNTALTTINEVEKDALRLRAYASLNADENLRDSAAQERRDRVDRLLARLQTVTSYVRPALTSMDQQKLSKWAQQPVLSEHQRFLEQVMRDAPHTLSPATESALAALSPVTDREDSYSLLTNADMHWPELIIDGKNRTLDQAGYARWRGSEDRALRQRVFETFWPVWQQYESTFGSLLGKQVLAHVIEARQRHYDSALSAALSPNDIPVAVYHQLIESTNEHLPTLHRYLRLRQRMLGVDQLHYYDIYPPLVKSDRTFTLTDARQLTRAATAPLGEHYASLLKRATGAHWTSARPQPGKRSGAYMNGSAYDVHPYVLMNFNGRYEDVSTYAHEWGHGIHSMLANEQQPYATASYPIFTAEVASTTNEQLLVDYMRHHAQSDREKLFYIGQALESLRSTFFRQTQFAEFELAIHEAVADGQALSGARLTRMYADLLKKYYGVDQGVTKINPDNFIEWAYVPHFYYNFYVYQYATSITAAHQFAERLEQGNDADRQRYLQVLASGGAEGGYQLLKKAGVDLATPAPYDALMAWMNRLMDQAETLLDRLDQPGS